MKEFKVTDIGEGVSVSIISEGDEKCIFCQEDHKEEKEESLPQHKYKPERNDEALTRNGRSFIKNDEKFSKYYPKDEEGNFVSPLENAEYSEDFIAQTYKTSSGNERAYASKYQAPPIHGWIAAPHHMIAICCMDGDNKLPAVPKLNPWAKKGNYDVNNGGNCIFLPSSASQFYVAYYYWKIRGTGQALQGHLGAHRAEYFKTVWDRLELIVRNGRKVKWCAVTKDEEDINELAKKVIDKMEKLQTSIFHKLAKLKPEEKYKLGAESYIEVPDESAEFAVPEGVEDRLQPYETLPKWY